MTATITIGALFGYIAIAVTLILCAVWTLVAAAARDPWSVLAGLLAAVVCFGIWWFCMAFTTSSDYHAWTVKGGEVEKIGKRLVSAGDSGMQERYVVTILGVPYGVDDTRASLTEPGDVVSLRCKKDFQWGVPREAHGWACRWNGATS